MLELGGKCEWDPWLEEFIFFIRRRWKPIFIMHWLIIFVGSAKTCIVGLFSRVCKVLEPRGVASRELLPHPQGRRGFELHFLILAFGQAYLCSYSVILLGRKCCVVGSSNRGTHRVNIWLVIQWSSCKFFGGVAKETPGLNFRSLALGQSFTIPHSIV